MSHIRAARIYNYIERLRRAIRREGTPEIQEAWDNLEPHVAIFLQAAAARDSVVSGGAHHLDPNGAGSVKVETDVTAPRHSMKP